MTFYIRTPYGRYLRNRNVERFLNKEWPFVEQNLFFPVNIKAEDNDFIITASLPGLKPEDINIQIINENVTLKGEFKNKLDEKATYILQERPSGKFSRTITLPDTLDAAKSEAHLENGVLILRISKAEESKPKTIKVATKA